MLTWRHTGEKSKAEVDLGEICADEPGVKLKIRCSYGKAKSQQLHRLVSWDVGSV